MDDRAAIERGAASRAAIDASRTACHRSSSRARGDDIELKVAVNDVKDGSNRPCGVQGDLACCGPRTGASPSGECGARHGCGGELDNRAAVESGAASRTTINASRTARDCSSAGAGSANGELEGRRRSSSARTSASASRQSECEGKNYRSGDAVFGSQIHRCPAKLS